MPATPPPSASKYRSLSALLALHAATEALKVRKVSLVKAATVLIQHQIAAATLSDRAVAQMLKDQRINVRPDASLMPAAFTTSPDTFSAMAESTSSDFEFERLVASITQETARAAQQAAVAVREDVRWVRHLTLPSCSRCAVLAGRVYRYSDGFLRHPGCDCTMIPTTQASPDYTYDPVALTESGQVTGLSKADRQALADGADFGKVVNVRQRAAGLTYSGRVLARADRPTPEAIYRSTSDRAAALEALRQYGYIR